MAASRAVSNSASVAVLGTLICFLRTPKEDVLEWTEETVEPPDSSIVSSQDIDSLLVALLCPCVEAFESLRGGNDAPVGT